MKTRMHGVIFINPYLIPKESVLQAERLKEELTALGVTAEIVTDGFLKTRIGEDEEKNGAVNGFFPTDFCVYLDKDKYSSAVLKKRKVRLFNPHEGIRICDDKGETYIALDGKVALPKTIFAPLCYNASATMPEEKEEMFFCETEKYLGFPMVVKESYGSMGKGVFLAENREELKFLYDKLKTKPHLYQQYLGREKGTDVRIICIGGKAVTAIKRVNKNDFRSNVAQGGKGEPFPLVGDFKRAAERAAKILKLDYCGVDLLFGDDGKPVICEVNSNAYFTETEKVTGVNIAKLYAEYIIKKVNGK